MKYHTARSLRLLVWCCCLLLLPLVFASPATAATRFTLPPIDAFITRWTPSGGSELGSSQAFLMELCDLLEVPRPQVPRPNLKDTSYLFEAAVPTTAPDGKVSQGRIDLYKRGCFVWESKQGSPQRPARDAEQWRGGTATRETRGWDEAMRKAKAQAEGYARALPASEGRPPFILISDIGYTIEIFADFRGTGVYTPFPSARDNRLTLDDLRRPEVRELLRRIWTDPLSLDPSRESAKVTQALALQLADLAASLEKSGYSADEASLFLQRCIFVMFAEDAGVLPHDSFTLMLERLVNAPNNFTAELERLWQSVQHSGIQSPLFAEARAIPLDTAQINLLHKAAQANWSNVDTSIFGTLLERALTPRERHQLGAHYTPPAYVERLVVPTIMEPLRAAWAVAIENALDKVSRGDVAGARGEVEGFFAQLRGVAILDPSCGSGNFLAVALILMKELEGEVVQALRDLGASDRDIQAFGTVEPRQFKGIEVVPRAAAISELVLWLTALQQHYAIHGNVPPSAALLQPAIHIERRDALLTWNSDGTARQADPWPQAEYIVGNPPFIGNKRMRSALGNSYVDALRKQYSNVPGSVDYVMYFWHHAAELLQRGEIQRFGLITTNKIRQTYNQQVVTRFFVATPPISFVYAVADHPWMDDRQKEGRGRVAIGVCARGRLQGILASVIEERREGHFVRVSLDARAGEINSNMTLGIDTAGVKSLKANEGICNSGVTVLGQGFIITAEKAKELGMGSVPGLERHIKAYRNGKDIAALSRGNMVIDLYGLSEQDIQQRFPAVYAWVLENVKPQREKNNRAGRREKWWLFGEVGPRLRQSLEGIERYIVTAQVARRRYFVFMDSDILPDVKLTTFASNDAYTLGVLSSKVHKEWELILGGKHGIGNDLLYGIARCFNTFPFPDATAPQKAHIRELAEQLDVHRKTRQNQYPRLTLTDMYAVLEQVRYGVHLTPKEQRISEQADIATLQTLHDALDAAVTDAYGWPGNLPADEILSRLVALNQERAAEEQRGLVRWLRPDFQTKPRP